MQAPPRRAITHFAERISSSEPIFAWASRMRLARFTEGGKKTSPFNMGALPEHSPSAPLPFLMQHRVLDTSVHLYKEFLDGGFSQAHDDFSNAENRERHGPTT